jgi:hypothetical protein
MSPGLMLKLATAEGERLVQLGPAWYIERQDLDLSPGDEVAVLASDVRLDGGHVFIAAEIMRGQWTLRLREPDTGHPSWSGWRSPQATARSASAERAAPATMAFAGALLDTGVRGPAGEPLGTLADLVADRQGRLVYGMLELAGEAEPVPVPWSALSVDGPRNVVTASTTLARLQAAPRVARRDLPTIAEGQMVRRIHRHFDADPSRVIASFERWWGRQQQLVEAGPMRRRTPMMMRYDVAAEQRWSGLIVDAAPEAEGLSLRGIEAFVLETEDGDRQLVLLGPSRFIEDLAIPIDVDAEVEVLGAPITQGGRTVLLASEVVFGDETFSLRDEQGLPTWRAAWRGPR